MSKTEINSPLYPQNIIINENKGYLLAKRLMDLSAAFLGIILFSWLFLLVPVLIKLDDPKGPIFFKQLRVGKNGKLFNMYKFRSMVPDAEEKLEELFKYNEKTRVMFKIKKDPRITKIGKIIRKTSIDELPQIWNVIKGEMSIVGPRPSLPREVQEYSENERQRLLVSPGCTGLWQISGRNNTSFKEMVDLDLYYMKDRSVFFDIKIMIKTFVLLVGSKKAS